MAEFRYITLREQPERMDAAASWFHSKWGVPKEAYVECMQAYLSKQTELGWFLCLDGGEIVGGLGVIENDFHDRPDLTPQCLRGLYGREPPLPGHCRKPAEHSGGGSAGQRHFSCLPGNRPYRFL